MTLSLPTVLISVTEEDIQRGFPNCDRCPVALAVSRQMGQHASVTLHWVRTADLLAKVPTVVRNFIEDFDRGLPVSPFNFQLEWWPDILATNLNVC